MIKKNLQRKQQKRNTWEGTLESIISVEEGSHVNFFRSWRRTFVVVRSANVRQHGGISDYKH